MKTIQFTQRQARLLRDNLTSNQEGYDCTDLWRLDSLAKKLSELQGEYGTRMAELAREERRIRRELARSDSPDEIAALERELVAMSFDVEDLNDAASEANVAFQVEDGDYKLIRDKIDSVNRWLGTDALRPIIIGMLESLKAASGDNGVSEFPGVKSGRPIRLGKK